MRLELEGVTLTAVFVERDGTRIELLHYAAPALVDIDGDEDLDLFVGSASGKLFLFRNEGNRFLPIYQLETADFLGSSLGLNLVPKFADANGDGLPDMALGNEAGTFFLLLNQGRRNAPRFCAAPRPVSPCTSAPRELGRVAPEDNAVPVWVDWDRDGDLDLMVGQSDGKIDYYLLPLYPALSLLNGRWFVAVPWRRLDRTWVRVVLLLVVAAIGVATLRPPRAPAAWLPGATGMVLLAIVLGRPSMVPAVY